MLLMIDLYHPGSLFFSVPQLTMVSANLVLWLPPKFTDSEYLQGMDVKGIRGADPKTLTQITLALLTGHIVLA